MNNKEMLIKELLTLQKQINDILLFTPIDDEFNFDFTLKKIIKIKKNLTEIDNHIGVVLPF